MKEQNQDTVFLLKECNAGCKMAENSMEQVKPYIKNPEMKTVLEHYRDENRAIGDQCHVLLNECGADEKDPHPAASAFSWISTEVKLAMDSGEKRIAELMIDGCNMGVKSVSQYVNQYPTASEKSVALAEKLIRSEQEFADQMRKFL